MIYVSVLSILMFSKVKRSRSPVVQDFSIHLAPILKYSLMIFPAWGTFHRAIPQRYLWPQGWSMYASFVTSSNVHVFDRRYTPQAALAAKSFLRQRRKLGQL